MARVLVTGATGCLGHRLTLELLAAGHQVLAQVRDPKSAQALAKAGARLLVADLRQPLSPDMLAGLDQLHHCAAMSSAWGRPEDFTAINVTATKSLLDAARVAGVGRFIFASSPSLYADGTDRLNLREDAPLPERLPSAYARSKFEAERLVLAADDPLGMRSIALRPRAIYGRGDRSLLPRLLAAMKRGRVPMIEGGRALIDLTHVGDAARAFVLAGNANIGGAAYNITSGEVFSFAQILDAVCAHSHRRPRRISLSYGHAMTIARILETLHKSFAPSREPVLTTQVVASLGRSLTLDITAARRDLGYLPQTRLAEGIRDYADVW